MKVLTNDEVFQILNDEKSGFNDCAIKDFSFEGNEFNNIDKAFSHCIFVNCSFAFSNLSHLCFENCQFCCCDFRNSEAYLTQFSKCLFDRCNFSNVRFEKTHFEQSVFRLSKFSKSDLYCTQFVQSRFQKEIVFENANLERAIFDNCKRDSMGNVIFDCFLNHTKFESSESLEPHYTFDNSFVALMKKTAMQKQKGEGKNET